MLGSGGTGVMAVFAAKNMGAKEVIVISRSQHCMNLRRKAVPDFFADKPILHNDPEHALCDGPQSLTPENFESLMQTVAAIRPFADR